ncbi:MAG: membrane protein YdbS with pleckstrin-like domain [Saprospiraceae bacterium]|jgi:membrane protein YdbS with pleckstrin-like domain
MIFTNTTIDISQLPQIETVSYEPLAPAWLKSSYIGTVIFFTFLLIPTLILPFAQGGEHPILYGIPVFWLLWLLLSLWLTKKDYKIRGYSLREKDIIYRKGVLFKSATVIPFNRVQHVEIKQGPIARYFGLHTLTVYTAGGESSDLSIPGLSGETAPQLKEYIIQKTTTTND